MTDKELRRMRREELLELLVDQTRRANALQAQLDEAQTQLASRQISVENVGSLAEAALQLSGVFQAAEEAGQLYLDNLRSRAEGLEDSQFLAETQERCRAMEAETQARCQAMEAETRARCDEKISSAQREANAYWEDLYVRLEHFYDTHAGMRQIMEEKQRTEESQESQL